MPRTWRAQGLKLTAASTSASPSLPWRTLGQATTYTAALPKPLNSNLVALACLSIFAFASPRLHQALSSASHLSRPRAECHWPASSLRTRTQLLQFHVIPCLSRKTPGSATTPGHHARWGNPRTPRTRDADGGQLPAKVLPRLNWVWCLFSTVADSQLCPSP